MPRVSVKIEQVHVDKYETLTIYLRGYGTENQVELRVLPNGKKQIFLSKDTEIELCCFDDWKDMDNEGGG